MTTDKNWWKTGFNKAYLRRLLSLYPENTQKQEVSFLIKNIPIKKTDSVLDLACGCGRHEIEFFKRGYHHVIGIDYSVDFIKEAYGRAKSEHARIHVQQSDVRSYTSENTFDVALLIGNSLGYGSDRDHKSMLKNANKNLKKGGRFVIEIPNGHMHLAHRKKFQTWNDMKTINGNQWIVEVSSIHKPGTNQVCSKWRVIKKETGKTIFRLKTNNRYYFMSQIEAFLHEKGFGLIKKYGSWDGAKFEEKKSPCIIIICEKI